MKGKPFARLVTSIACLTLVLLTGCAQQPTKVARVGWMSIATPSAPALNYDVFREAMRDLGYSKAGISFLSLDIAAARTSYFRS